MSFNYSKKLCDLAPSHKHMEQEKENNAQHFLDLIQKSRKGKFKVYIGMSAGVGKTYRMLQEAHSLLKNGIDVKIGYIETHMRKETHEPFSIKAKNSRNSMFRRLSTLDPKW